MKNYIIVILVSLLFILQSCNNNTDSNRRIQEIPRILSDSNNQASCVFLTVDENNNPVISWCEKSADGKKLFFMSYLNENNFLQRIKIPVEQNVEFQEEGMPRIAFKGDGSIIAMYEISSPTIKNKWAGSIHFIQSVNKGKSWSQPQSVSADVSPDGSQSYASLTRLSNGEIGVCWLDQSKNFKMKGRPIKFAMTKLNEGFQNEIVIDSMACECCRTSISSSKEGKINIVYRSILLDSIRDISISTSRNNGQTFSSPVSFSNDNWAINGCPDNGPDVINSGNATFATWYTGGSQKGVYYAELNAENKMNIKKQISKNGRNIQLCFLPDGSRVLAYNEYIFNSDSVYKRIVINKTDGKDILEKEITQPKAHATYPVLISTKNNKIVVAWNDNDKIYYSIIDANQIIKKVTAENSSIAIIAVNNIEPECGMK